METRGVFTVSLVEEEGKKTVGFWYDSVRGLSLLWLSSGWQELWYHPGRIHSLIGEGTTSLWAVLRLCSLVGE